MDTSSSGFESWNEDSFDATNEPSTSSLLSEEEDNNEDVKSRKRKYNYVQKDPNEKRVKGQRFDPIVICNETKANGKLCLEEIRQSCMSPHYKLNHGEEEIKKKRKTDNFFSACKSKENKCIAEKITFFQLDQQAKNKPKTFPILPTGTEPKGDQDLFLRPQLFKPRSMRSRKKWTGVRIMERYVICQFKPPDDKPEMTMKEMMDRYEHDPSFESKWFYDVSSEKGPCYSTHLRKNSTSPVTEADLVDKWSTFIMRIKFGDGKADSKTTKHENFRAAMNWQHPYCVLAHYKRVHGVGGGTGMKITMMNQKVSQKSNFICALSPEEDKKMVNIAVHGTQIYYPVQNYEDLLWEKFTFPKTTTVLVKK